MYEQPIFEIIDGGKHYKIYESGKIEGFGPTALVFNRIPVRVNKVVAGYCKELEKEEEGR